MRQDTLGAAPVSRATTAERQRSFEQRLPGAGLDAPHSLRAIRLFADWDEERLARLSCEGEIRKFKAGDLFGSAEFGAPCVFFVLDGVFRVSMMSPAARLVAIHTAEPGDHFGEVAVFAPLAWRDYYIQCDRPGACFLLSARSFQALLLSDPKISEAVIREIAMGATILADRVYEFATLDLRYRLLAELVRLAARGRRQGEHVTIVWAPTHQALAAQIGSSREGVTRLMKQLARQGLIKIPRRGEIVIPDLHRLKEMLTRQIGAEETADAD